MLLFKVGSKTYTITTIQVSYAEHPLAEIEAKHVAIAVCGQERITIPGTIAETTGSA